MGNVRNYHRGEREKAGDLTIRQALALCSPFVPIVLAMIIVPILQITNTPPEVAYDKVAKLLHLRPSPKVDNVDDVTKIPDREKIVGK